MKYLSKLYDVPDNFDVDAKTRSSLTHQHVYHHTIHALCRINLPAYTSPTAGYILADKLSESLMLVHTAAA